MITEQLIWFIDSRYDHQNIALDKIVQLANIHNKNVKIIIDASTQISGRGYWHLLQNKETISNELMLAIEEKQAKLEKFFTMNSVKVEIFINKTSDYLSALNTHIAYNEKSIVVIQDNIVAKRHPIFQGLTDINSPVLILNMQAWKHPIKFLAAVDPLHEHARPGKIDDDIVLITRDWAKTLQAKWTVAHCCYVASVLTQYKNRIIEMHSDGLSIFARSLRLAKDQYVLLEGVPEDALTKYIHQHHIDILTMGIVARNKLEQLWVGSTTTALLSNLPCDLLLIKE